MYLCWPISMNSQGTCGFIEKKVEPGGAIAYTARIPEISPGVTLSDSSFPQRATRKPGISNAISNATAIARTLPAAAVKASAARQRAPGKQNRNTQIGRAHV